VGISEPENALGRVNREAGVQREVMSCSSVVSGGVLQLTPLEDRHSFIDKASSMVLREDPALCSSSRCSSRHITRFPAKIQYCVACSA
jgi:hypothetical protein